MFSVRVARAGGGGAVLHARSLRATRGSLLAGSVCSGLAERAGGGRCACVPEPSSRVPRGALRRPGPSRGACRPGPGSSSRGPRAVDRSAAGLWSQPGRARPGGCCRTVAARSRGAVGPGGGWASSLGCGGWCVWVVGGRGRGVRSAGRRYVCSRVPSVRERPVSWVLVDCWGCFGVGRRGLAGSLVTPARVLCGRESIPYSRIAGQVFTMGPSGGDRARPGCVRGGRA